MTHPVTVTESLKLSTRALEPIAGGSARLEAELLHAHVLGVDRMRLYLDASRILTEGEAQSIGDLMARRFTHEPIAYILGETEFWSLSFKVSRDTLIPRPDTETLVETVLERVPGQAQGHIIDLGTGTGCILLAILSERAGLSGVGVDIMPGAIDLARNNAETHDLSGRAGFIQSDWFQGARVPAGGFDIVVSNPPYIDEAAAESLMKDVRDHEPVSALVGGADGLDAYRIIAREAVTRIRSGGLLALEIGHDQGASVPALLEAAGWQNIEVKRDLGGNDRVVTAVAP